MSYCVAAYLGPYLKLSTREKKFKKAIKKLSAMTKQFDTIAFTGVSGALVGPILARELKKHITVVRKHKTQHSYRRVEGYAKSKKYLIVDDLIDTGATVKRIKKAIKNELSDDSICIGTFTMSDMEFTPA